MCKSYGTWGEEEEEEEEEDEEEEEKTRGLWLLETAHKAFPHMIYNISQINTHHLF